MPVIQRVSFLDIEGLHNTESGLSGESHNRQLSGGARALTEFAMLVVLAADLLLPTASY